STAPPGAGSAALRIFQPAAWSRRTGSVLRRSASRRRAMTASKSAAFSARMALRTTPASLPNTRLVGGGGGGATGAAVVGGAVAGGAGEGGGVAGGGVAGGTVGGGGAGVGTAGVPVAGADVCAPIAIGAPQSTTRTVKVRPIMTGCFDGKSWCRRTAP